MPLESSKEQKDRGSHRGLHGKEGHNLEQVVLEHISDDAIGVEVASAALCAKVFAENDLDVADELTAPQGLKNQICESEHLRMP